MAIGCKRLCRSLAAFLLAEERGKATLCGDLVSVQFSRNPTFQILLTTYCCIKELTEDIWRLPKSFLSSCCMDQESGKRLDPLESKNWERGDASVLCPFLASLVYLVPE